MIKNINTANIYSAYKNHKRSYTSLKNETWELIDSILNVKKSKKGKT